MSGFENFPTNGFDQLLINVTNEKLQQYFMDYIFPREQMDYEREGIAWRNISYHSNEEALELIFKVMVMFLIARFLFLSKYKTYWVLRVKLLYSISTTIFESDAKVICLNIKVLQLDHLNMCVYICNYNASQPSSVERTCWLGMFIYVLNKVHITWCISFTYVNNWKLCSNLTIYEIIFRHKSSVFFKETGRHTAVTWRGVKLPAVDRRHFGAQAQELLLPKQAFRGPHGGRMRFRNKTLRWAGA